MGHPTQSGNNATNTSHLFRYLTDPRGPEEVLTTLAPAELAELLDALYQNLDTPEPDFGAEAWYEMAVEESSRRSAPPNGAAQRLA